MTNIYGAASRRNMKKHSAGINANHNKIPAFINMCRSKAAERMIFMKLTAHLHNNYKMKVNSLQTLLQTHPVITYLMFFVGAPLFITLAVGLITCTVALPYALFTGII